MTLHCNIATIDGTIKDVCVNHEKDRGISIIGIIVNSFTQMAQKGRERPDNQQSTLVGFNFVMAANS